MSMAICAMVAGAIAGMLGAVSAGVGTRKDNREIMVLAHAAQSRLAAYMATARCILQADGSSLTLWLNDDRESGTVHATEIRWLRFDVDSGELRVEFIAFPASWTPTAMELADREYPATTDWSTVRAYYQSRGFLASQALIDHLQEFAVAHDQDDAYDSSHVVFELGFVGQSAVVTVPVSGTLQVREEPVK